jgi:hypothetical protein
MPMKRRKLENATMEKYGNPPYKVIFRWTTKEGRVKHSFTCITRTRDIKLLGNVYRRGQAGRIYSPDGIAPTLVGKSVPLIIERNKKA